MARTPLVHSPAAQDTPRGQFEYPFSMKVQAAVPVLQVRDVGASLLWYGEHLGFTADTFPEEPPYSFAILTAGKTELMLQCSRGVAPRTPKPFQWDVYLRIGPGQIRSLHQRLSKLGLVTRRLERAFYGLIEFEVSDPDGHGITVSAPWDDGEPLPAPEG